MSAIDDFTTAMGAVDDLMDQAAAFISGTPAVIAAAVALQQQNDTAGLATLQATVQTHASALSAALTPPTVTATTPAITVPGA
jgi:hypothetical protein